MFSLAVFGRVFYMKRKFNFYSHDKCYSPLPTFVCFDVMALFDGLGFYSVWGTAEG